MQIITVENTKLIPSAGPFLCVQAKTMDEAVRELKAIATRRGITIADTVYQWGKGYYYVQILSVKEEVAHARTRT